MESNPPCNLGLRDNQDRQIGPGTATKLVSVVRSGKYPNDTPKATMTWINCDGSEESADVAASRLPIRTELLEGATCVGEPSPEPGPGLPDPVPVPDPNGGPCTYETQIIDSYINAAGGMSILYETCATHQTLSLIHI